MPFSPPNHDAKTDLRRQLRARRNALSDAQHDEFSARIVAHLQFWLRSLDIPRVPIALYEALPREVDLSSLLKLPFEFVVPRRVGGNWIDADEEWVFERCSSPHPNAAQRAPGPQAGEGVTFRTASCCGEHSSLSRLRAGCPLGGVGVGAEHVTQPQVLAPSQVGIFFVPGLAFDVHGHRIGQGGGWYDRVLARAPHAPKIGVAFECQVIERVPHEAHDVIMDAVVTENGWRKYLPR